MSRDPNLTTRFDSLLANQAGQGFYNTVTGMGTARDKSVYTQYNPTFVPLDTQVLSALYHGHDLAARVVNVIPDEELRLDFTVEVPGDEAAERLIREEFERLEVRQNALDGRVYGRAFGGAATILGAEDGKAAYEPLDVRRVRQIDWLRTVDRRYLWPNTWYSRGPKNGKVETYCLNDAHPGGSESFVIHESRLILWPGARTAQQEKDQNNSWDHSELDRCWPALKAFETIYKGVELLITDGPQAVYKVKGLFDKIVAGEENQLRTRFELIDMYRSMMRAIIIDADGSESFERQQVTYSGTPEILVQMQLRLSAATQIPMLVLFGQAPGGLGVTGENDLKWFFDRTASSQRNVLAPRLKQIAQLILRAARIEAQEIKVKFEDLWTPSAKEQAEERFLQAQTDEKYLTNSVLTPEEVLLSRFKDKGLWSSEWSAVDRGVREKMLKDVLKALVEGGPDEPGSPTEPEDPEPKPRQDYDPNQLRDENGRWTVQGKTDHPEVVRVVKKLGGIDSLVGAREFLGAESTVDYKVEPYRDAEEDRVFYADLSKAERDEFDETASPEQKARALAGKPLEEDLDGVSVKVTATLPEVKGKVVLRRTYETGEDGKLDVTLDDSSYPKKLGEERIVEIRRAEIRALRSKANSISAWARPGKDTEMMLAEGFDFAGPSAKAVHEQGNPTGKELPMYWTKQ